MKIDEQLLSNISQTLKTDYEKAKDKSKPSSSRDPQSLVSESNQEAYLVSITMVDKAGSALKIRQPEEANQVAEKLKSMILPNPREAGNAHANLNARRVRDLLSE
jgi:hypothetical protein